MVTVEKVEGGFEYRIGELVIARSRFVKRQGGWKLVVIHMTRCRKPKFATMALGAEAIVDTPNEALGYVHQMLGAQFETRTPL